MSTAGQPYKVAIVVDEGLPSGLAANTAAVLALSIGRQVETIIGPVIKDGDGSAHAGITTIPIPILTAAADKVREIRNDACTRDVELLVVDFTDCAQKTRNYADYGTLLEAATGSEINYLGVALYGPKKAVQRLTGSLPLLR
ncbi:DUF2000 domain-containing protein [Amycolatopsis sp. WAC 01376]|uniref:DUF2000 domain-containing protein n=1 Tax=Amycolatopsis sp. WAC 01376 TaxID=2203195 RepID=UPI000F7A2804|nr:DUF2000 domain-containing protein [Amycolatopsis sp. WAC 01376]RSM53538.1 DUF2000 domain-containing protein [Amycolatopsis sp. WAC 01376]